MIPSLTFGAEMKPNQGPRFRPNLVFQQRGAHESPLEDRVLDPGSSQIMRRGPRRIAFASSLVDRLSAFYFLNDPLDESNEGFVNS